MSLSWNYASTGVAGAALCQVSADAWRQRSTQQSLHEVRTREEISGQVPEDTSECKSSPDTSQPASDDELEERSLQGDSSAFGALVLRYYTKCLNRAIFII